VKNSFAIERPATSSCRIKVRALSSTRRGSEDSPSAKVTPALQRSGSSPPCSSGRPPRRRDRAWPEVLVAYVPLLLFRRPPSRFCRSEDRRGRRTGSCRWWSRHARSARRWTPTAWASGARQRRWRPERPREGLRRPTAGAGPALASLATARRPRPAVIGIAAGTWVAPTHRRRRGCRHGAFLRQVAGGGGGPLRLPSASAHGLGCAVPQLFPRRWLPWKGPNAPGPCRCRRS
jgi:hypothetical protein